MEAKRQRVLDLLHAQVEIMKIVDMSRATVFRVKSKMAKGEGVKRKEGSGGHNRKLSDEFLANLKEDIEASPMTSMRTLAKDKNVDEKTIQNAVSSLELTSYR